MTEYDNFVQAYSDKIAEVTIAKTYIDVNTDERCFNYYRLDIFRDLLARGRKTDDKEHPLNTAEAV